jgi:hypothetical protein
MAATPEPRKGLPTVNFPCGAAAGFQSQTRRVWRSRSELTPPVVWLGAHRCRARSRVGCRVILHPPLSAISESERRGARDSRHKQHNSR